ncbi:CapA family protein [Streptomyces qinzhouensis]|uniref:CapA family protein n=1 Tax=Streptomyces qinzhouensis TaxID=2599401 RepID=A0A5B8INL8_9ACTN|nr:CapA family protein [Streptomyces qinzhouensis]QDY80252.1 CapA family protein [Streptomyces qinzhouensis]
MGRNRTRRHTARRGGGPGRYGAPALAVLLLAAGTTACAAPGPEPAAPRASPSAARGSVPDRAFTLVASGDVLPHDSVIARARGDAEGPADGGYDFRPMLAAVRPFVSAADLAICHMETVYGADGDYRGYPAFTSPPQIARGLAATGYDACSTASNHTLDDGADGIRRTLDAMDTAGLVHHGSARTAEEAALPGRLKAGGAEVAHLAYTYGTNGQPLPDGQPWAVRLIDEQRILDDARAARRAGADIVVLSLHWGTEWQTAPDEQQLTLAKSLTAANTGGRPDIDLVLGTHAHVPQAYEKVNGTWVIYGMGDQIAGPMFDYSGARDHRGNMGSIGRFTFGPPKTPGGRWEVTRAEFVPQWYDTDSGRVVNLPAAVAEDSGRDDYRSIQDTVAETVLSRGAAKDGLTMAR